MDTVKYFINLTNGIEAIPNLQSEYSFIRIQSTACEQHLWDKIILDLDYNFLMCAALGNTCIIFDYGARKNTPRAIYQGVEFIKYVLWKHWHDVETKPMVKGVNCTKYFNEIYSKLSKQTIKKLNYFKPFVLGDKIKILCKTSSTSHDGDRDFYKNTLHGVGLADMLFANYKINENIDRIRYSNS